MAQRKQTTIMLRNKKMWVLSALLLSLMSAGLANAEDDTDMTEPEAETQQVVAETHRYASLQSGYRFVTPDGPMAAASPYGRFKSGVTGGFSAGTLGSDLKLMINGDFLHEDDYHTELFLDYAGLVRFHVESAVFWHNLLREQVNPGTLTLRPLDQDVTYGIRNTTTQVDSRIKLGNNPFHLNLGYWELKRDGFEQLRFSDHSFGTAANSVISETIRVDRITREGSVGIDGHLGLFDLSYGFRIRDFSNEAVDSRYNFNNTAGGTLSTGTQAHDTIPDSRLTSHTVKLYSDLSGGLVGSASYTLTQRENIGGHGEAVPSERPSDTIHSVAGDLSYTPSKRHSFALKYRHQEIDRSTPATLNYPYSQVAATTPGELPVRPATSSVNDTLTLSATFRPAPKVIYRLEYKAELETRDNVRDAQSPINSTTELHSDSRQTHTGSAVFYWKPVTGVKINTFYSYAACDNPSYGSSFSDRHTGKILLTYTANGKWGASANYLAKYETGEFTASTVLTPPLASASYNLPRESRTGSGNVSIWFSPLERLTVTTHYSYLKTNINQSILFTNIIVDPDPLVAGNYRSSSHIYGLDAVYTVIEPLDISLAFQQVRSKARFEVPDRSFALTGNFNTSGITELTRLNSTETGASARADWRITPHLGCSLDYSFRMFESGQAIYDGSVHSTMVALKARW